MLSHVLIAVTIVIYLAAMVFIGIRCSKKNKNTDDFYLGGRQLGPFVTAMSAEASDMSGWLLMGLPGVALAGGLILKDTGAAGYAEALWTALGLAVGTYLNWLIVAKRLRRYSEKINANTIPDFFSNRFRDKSGLLLGISAVIIIVFFVPYTASGFASVGKLFNSLFGVDYHLAMIIGALVIFAYTVIGGFLAASTTDFVQSIIMTMALVVVCGFAVFNVGGMDNTMAFLKDVPEYFSFTGVGGKYGFLPIVSTLAWGLGYFGMPHILLRFMAIKDEKKLKTSRRVASIWVVISMGVAIFIGIAGIAFVKANNLIGEGFDSERIVIYVANALSQVNPFWAIIAGVIISGIMASIMSTSDSQMLAASSSMSENIIKRFFWKNMSEKTQMLIARATVLLITVVSVGFAWNPDSSVFYIVSFAWAGFGASFGPLVLCSLFWKRTTKWGAFAGILSGGATVFIWKYAVRPLGGAWDLYELLPAFIVSLLAIVIVSLLTKKPSQDVLDDFDAVKAMK